jgi:hypothetical protein
LAVSLELVCEPLREGQIRTSGPSSENLDATREIVDFFLGL